MKDLSKENFEFYVRAYALYVIGSIIAPDGSGAHVPVFYLPLLEDIDKINGYAWGASLLVNLQVSICKVVNPKPGKQIGGTNITGFVYSLLVSTNFFIRNNGLISLVYLRRKM